MSTIQLTKQIPLEEIITAVKNFKRNGEKISDLIRAQNITAAMALLKQEQTSAAQIQAMLNRCQDTYLSPETAKKVMMIKRQFKEQRIRVAQEFHSARQTIEQPSHSSQHQDQQEIEGFDFDIQSRLLREKGESLTKVNQKIINIQSVMHQTQSLTFQQGEKLDLVSDNLEKTLTNTTTANQHLNQANQYSKQHNKCCLWLLVFVLIVVCVILIIVLVLCFFLTVNCLKDLINALYFKFISRIIR